MFGQSPVELMAANAMMLGGIYCENFTYSANWLTGTGSALGANATVDQQIQINSDSDFVLQIFNGVSYSAADTPIVAPDYLVNVVMAGSGRQIFDTAQDWVTFVGNYSVNRVPGILTFPRIIPANNTVTVTLTNRTGTAANRVKLSLKGFKVWYLTTNRKETFHVL
jgi:hypothetical protein